MFGLEPILFFLLFLCLFLACAFEFVNGFHDTANAVATVIYTNSLKPTQAVVWSGFINLLGLLTGGVGVTMSIIGLLPTELLIDPNVYHSMAMAMSMLLAAIIWNVGTWYFGIPSSSSHTLIGSIIGVGLGYAMIQKGDKKFDTVNWDKAIEIFEFLLIAPLVGFGLAIILMFILKKVLKVDGIFKEPKGDQVPPTWIRGVLIATCTMVSFMHGRNDGQKGIGLVMMILIAFLPGKFAVNPDVDPFTLNETISKAQVLVTKIDTVALSAKEKESYYIVSKSLASLHKIMVDASIDHKDINRDTKLEIRNDVLNISKHVKKLVESESVSLTGAEKKELKTLAEGKKAPFFTLHNANGGLSSMTDFAPDWVIWMIAISLGLGTMIGWKRIVVTIGEKIGKQHLSYAQGAIAELTASITIGISTAVKFPVSTTHILSSGIAGTMVASKGIKNLQGGTVKNIALAWVLTLPVSIFLSATIFIILRWIIG